MSSPLRVLELFSGIGGCAAALQGAAPHVAVVVAAVDINRKASAVYRLNFPHPHVTRTIESIPVSQFATWNADLWWMSPPCQPYTVRGRQRDVDDPRAASFLALLDRIRAILPTYLALENVPWFHLSRSHARLRETLRDCGYQVQEKLLCPTEFGIPNRRRRFYLVASRHELRPWPAVKVDHRHSVSLPDLLEHADRPELKVDEQLMADYQGALHVVDAEDPGAISYCFTASYGKSMAFSGSYLKTRGGIRRFSPREILRLLRFPQAFQLPDAPARSLWPLVGNSLSVAAVKYVLACVPELSALVAENKCEQSVGRGRERSENHRSTEQSCGGGGDKCEQKC